MSETPLRIAICADGRSPHTSRWVNWIADRGHAVTLVWRPDQFDEQLHANYRSRVRHIAAEPVPVLASPLKARNVRARLRALGAELRPDIVHGLYLQYHGWTACDLDRRPVVLSALGSDALGLSGPLPHGLRPALAERLSRRRSRGGLRAADTVFCDSEAIASSLRQSTLRSEPVLIRFGVERGANAESRAIWRKRLGIEDDQPVVLSTRLLRPLYNIDVLIRAFPAVLASDPRAVLVVKELDRLGDPDYRARCLELATDLGINSSLRFVGELPRADLLAIYAAADAFVSIPSSDGTAVSVLEAMAAGIPVVATNAPGVDQNILRDRETALLVPVGDAEAVSAALTELLRFPSLAEHLRCHATALVARVGDFDTEMERAESLYHSLVEDAVHGASTRRR